MAEKRVGAIILAAGKSEAFKEFRPMMQVGQTTMIQKEIDTLRQAGVSPIVVVTGYQAETLEKHIAHRGVIFVRNKRHEASKMYDSVRLGLRRVQKKVDRVLLMPADMPMVSAETVTRMMEAGGAAAIPVCQGRSGHPVMLSQELFSFLLDYEGNGGLRGAMDACGMEIGRVELEDPGVLLGSNSSEEYEELLRYEKEHRNRTQLVCKTAVCLTKESDCFSSEAAGFLEAIGENGSMLAACQALDLSYSKGWKLVKLAEEELGIRFLARQAGGRKGGSSTLTKEALEFLARYRALEREVADYAKEAFARIFEVESEGAES